MENFKDLRKILSHNIKTVRSTLHISQAKLAEFAGISLSYLTDIERCRTWVSDKTLQGLAKALNREAWELLLPINGNSGQDIKEKLPVERREKIQQIADLILKKREILHRTADHAMEDLIMEILQKE